MTKAEIKKQAAALAAMIPEYAQEIATRKSEKPTYRAIDRPGDYMFRIEEFKMLDSFTQYNGERKAEDKLKNFDQDGNELPMYVDAATVLALKLRCVGQHEDDDNNGKTHFVRLQFGSYKKYNKLSQEQLESGDYTNIRGYACEEYEPGLYRRILSAEGMEAVKRIHDQFCHAVGLAEQASITEAVVTAYAEGTTFGLKLVADEYNHKQVLKEKNYFPAVALQPEAQTADLEADFDQ